MRIIKTIMAIFGLVIVLPIIVFVWMASPETEATQPRQLTDAEVEQAAARRVCKDAITERLNDPASAEWEPMHRWVAANNKANDKEYLVQTTMRARNAMGGMIRTSFQCRFQRLGDTMALIEVTEY